MQQSESLQRRRQDLRFVRIERPFSRIFLLDRSSNYYREYLSLIIDIIRVDCISINIF
jgi:hypothetical protein